MIIRRTTIPYAGRSRFGGETSRKARRRAVTYSSSAGLIPVIPTGTAQCELSVAVSNIYDTDLPATVNMEVIGQVDNQRVPTYVQIDDITGGTNAMTITVTDNGTDSAVMHVALPANFNAVGKLTIPVLVNVSTGADLIKPLPGQTMEDAFANRSRTTKQLTVYWEYNILHVASDGTIIRGPVRWTPNLARRFSNGQGPLAEDRLYMDVVRYGHNTYKCITSYTQTSGSTWASVSSNWQMDNSFSIIASGLDLDFAERIELDDSNLIVVNNGSSDVITIGTAGIDAIGTITCGESRTRALNVVNSLGSTAVSISGSGAINAGSVSASNIAVSGTASASNVWASAITGDAIRLRDQIYEGTYRTPLRAQLDLDLSYITDYGQTMFTNDGGDWMFNGVDTHVDSTVYPSIVTSRSADNVGAEHECEYFFCREDGVIGESSVPSGVFTSNHVKVNSRIYLNLDNGVMTSFGVSFK